MRAIVLGWLVVVMAVVSVYGRPAYAPRNAFAVNQGTTDSQHSPRVVRNAEGRTLVVWTDERNGTDGDVYGRVFSMNADPITDEFRVNQTTVDEQKWQDAAMDTEGNFVVVWHDYAIPRTIKARLYDSTGTPLTDEFQVNTNATGTVAYPAVAMASNGNFIVSWSRADFGNAFFDLYYRQFLPNGFTTQPEQPVVNSDGHQRIQSDVAMLSTSCFLIAWNEQVAPQQEPRHVFARVYDGPWPTAYFQVSQTAGSMDNSPPRVAMYPPVRSVIVWGAQSNEGQNVRARLYNATAPQTDEFAVAYVSEGVLYSPDVAANAAGDFVVVWDWTKSCCPSRCLYAQRFLAGGTPLGVPFNIVQSNTASAYEPAIAMDNQGGLAMSWSAYDADNLGIFARILEGSPNVVNDFDGDLRSDLALYWAEQGTWYVQRSASGYTNRTLGGLSELPVAGDYDGDWLADFSVYDTQTGIWDFRYSSGTVGQLYWGWDIIPMHADFNGDRELDVAVYNPADGMWYIRYSTGAMETFQFGWAGAVPVPGDYDRDNKCDIAVYDPVAGNWYIHFSSIEFTWVENFGWAEALPVPADYDGDEITDIAVYYPRDGDWYIKQSTGGLRLENWGWEAAWPVPGDYDGDGAQDICVYYPQDGSWYILFANGSSSNFSFGWAEALPTHQQFQINRRFGLIP
ncbi:MAG: VCBS repeat-containing protein [Spartobacteria bacterium]|nr:VCBS repeat-containing protein [Spartobacteria bacterium]